MSSATTSSATPSLADTPGPKGERRWRLSSMLGRFHPALGQGHDLALAVSGAIDAGLQESHGREIRHSQAAR
jgi:hypothetical protein